MAWALARGLGGKEPGQFLSVAGNAMQHHQRRAARIMGGVQHKGAQASGWCGRDHPVDGGADAGAIL